MRAKGEGTIYYDEGADRWRGELNLGKDGRGKHRRVKVTGRTKKEAAEKLAAKRTDRDSNIDRVNMTVRDLVDEWLTKATVDMTTRTLEFNRWAAERMAEELGAYLIADLKVHHVEEALEELTEDLNRTSLGRTRGTLSRILQWGVDRDYNVRDVAKHAELPKARPAKSGRALTEEELTKLLTQFEGNRIEALWRLMATTALRPAEALGLTWDNLDLDEGTLFVGQALKWANGKPYLGDTKTKRSRRTLALPTPLVAVLKAHRRNWVQERLGLGWSDQWSDLVFLSENGTPFDLSNLRRTIAAAADKAKIGHVKPYDLRHTCATLASENGMTIEEVADMLGHQGLDLARDTYAHHRESRVIKTFVDSDTDNKNAETDIGT